MRLMVDNQKVYSYSGHEPIADKSIQFVLIEFTLSSEWDGYTCVAQFTQGEKTYSKPLYNNTVTLPNELIAGQVEISLFGVRPGYANRGTTQPYLQEIVPSGFVSTEETPIPPTPDLYSQLIEQVVSAQQGVAEDSKAAASAAKTAQQASETAVQAAEDIGNFESQAEAHAEDAAGFAGRAKMFATLAEQSAATHGFFYTYIDDNGHLHYVRSDGLSDLNMRIQNGRLIASYGVA